MRVLSLSMILLNSNMQTREKCTNQYRLAFTSETSQPSEPSGFNNMTHIVKSNNYINGKWTGSFDNAFITGDTEGFSTDIENSKLKSLFQAKEMNGANEISSVPNPDSADFPLNSATVKNDDLSVTVDKSAHIQINYGDGEHLFLEASDLSEGVTMDDIGKSIITGGVRGFDPFDQDDWAKTALGSGWPTSADTRAPEGVATLFFDKSKQGIFINTPQTVGQAYGVHPRALVLNKGNSVIFAFQQEVLNPDIDFGAWSILPFKVKEGKQAFAIFPVQEEIAKKIEDINAKEFDEARESGKWSVFGDKRKFCMVEASKSSKKKSDFIGKGTDWSMFATEGDDHIWVIRNCFNESELDKIFKIYSEGEAGGGKNYVELEAIAPRVGKGQKSTLVYRLDRISLKDLGLDAKRLTSKNMKDILQEAARIIEDKMVYLRKIAA